MKRDPDLIRAILMKVEEGTDPVAGVAIEVGGHSDEEVWYHVWLLHDAGLLVAKEAFGMGREAFKWLPLRLTWAGHELLDASRDLTLWRKVRGAISKQGGSFTIEMLKRLLIEVANEAVQQGGL